MGYTRHHAIVVTSWSDTSIAIAHEKASQLFTTRGSPYGGSEDHTLVSPVIRGTTNGYSTFVVVPDGSNEGWDESSHWDGVRELFVWWLQEHKDEDSPVYVDWAEIRYGDGDGQDKLVRSNHKEGPGDD